MSGEFFSGVGVVLVFAVFPSRFCPCFVFVIFTFLAFAFTFAPSGRSSLSLLSVKRSTSTASPAAVSAHARQLSHGIVPDLRDPCSMATFVVAVTRGVQSAPRLGFIVDFGVLHCLQGHFLCTTVPKQGTAEGGPPNSVSPSLMAVTLLSCIAPNAVLQSTWDSRTHACHELECPTLSNHYQ